MYLRFNHKFGDLFTREMRINIYNEIVFREAFALLTTSGSDVRRKLKKAGFFYSKSLLLRFLSYLPIKVALRIFNFLKRS